MLFATFQSQAPDPGSEVLKSGEGFLNFVPTTLASQQWPPALSKGMIEIQLLCIEISCP